MLRIALRISVKHLLSKQMVYCVNNLWWRSLLTMRCATPLKWLKFLQFLAKSTFYSPSGWDHKPAVNPGGLQKTDCRQSLFHQDDAYLDADEQWYYGGWWLLKIRFTRKWHNFKFTSCFSQSTFYRTAERSNENLIFRKLAIQNS